MALKKLASIALRTRRTCQVAALSAVALTMAGCGHGRQSYRPVYASPAPCTNCGGSSTTVSSPAVSGPTVSSEVTPSSGTVMSVPSLTEPPPSDLPAASSAAPSRQRVESSRGSAVEKPPKARLDDEPPFDETLSPAPASSLGRSTTPPPAPKPVSPGSGSVPALQGPSAAAASPTSWDDDSQKSEQIGSTAAPRVRRASLSERLKPFVDDSNADQLLYPNKVDRPWRYIVLHHSASASGNYDQIDGEHRKVLGIDGCGYHFVIGNGTGSRDGQIEVSQRWINQKQGAHTRNAKTHDADEYGIGICLVGDFDQQPPSARQIAATQALIAYLSKRYEIASSGVRTHAHLAATKTVCPGKYFPSEAMLNLTKDGMTERPVRATWKFVRDTTQR